MRGESRRSPAGGAEAVFLLALILSGFGASFGGEEAELIGSGRPDSLLGLSVALDGDTAVAGAPWDDQLGVFSGSARVFVRDAFDTWSLQAELLAFDGIPSDHFGASVALDGDTLVVGASGGDSTHPRPGSAYVYTRDAAGTWTLAGKLVASDSEAADEFGRAVALQGDIIVVGAPEHDHSSPHSGAAYVFARDSTGLWRLEAKLVATDGGNFDGFGASVAIDNQTNPLEDPTVVVGAPRDGNYLGSVYIFTRDALGVWRQERKLIDPNADRGDRFGLSVARSGRSLAVGTQTNEGAGSVILLRQDPFGGWSQEAEVFQPGNSVVEALFGASIALEGDTLVIGAPRRIHSAYIFRRELTGWIQLVHLDPFLGSFGWSVALSGNTFVIGAPSGDAIYAADLDLPEPTAGVPDADEPPTGDATAISPAGNLLDEDGDGLNEPSDNCPLIPNPEQADVDRDGIGDACDNCLFVNNPWQADGDWDTVGDLCDNCLGTANPGQADDDADGIGDVCDTCPLIPDPEQADGDGDGIGDACDNCLVVNNPSQADGDRDTLGDRCDNCARTGNPGQADGDADGIGDVCDTCVLTVNPDQADADGDGIGDVCQATRLVAFDFEDGEQGWTATSRGGANTWHLATQDCLGFVFLGSTAFVSNSNSGPMCMVNSSREHSQLLSLPISLPDTSGALRLSFDALSFDEAGSCTDAAGGDAADVGVTTDGGETYVILNYCHALANGFGTWVHNVVDISFMAGETVQVIFVYDTRTTGFGYIFAIDNVTVAYEEGS